MKKSWLDRFSRACRWYLPPEESREVIADYQDMLAGDGRTEEELCRDLGKPRQAVQPLVQPESYRTWLAVFALLAVCLALPGLSPLSGMVSRFWSLLFGRNPVSLPLALVGVAVAIACSRWEKRRAGKPPRGVLVLLVLLLVWLVAILAVNWVWMHNLEGFWGMWGQTPLNILWVRIDPDGYTVAHCFRILLKWIGGPGMVLVGLFALLKARTEHRRWAAVYILAMTVMMVSLTTLALLTSIDLGYADWWVPTFRSCLCYAAVGLVATGAALC